MEPATGSQGSEDATVTCHNPGRSPHAANRRLKPKTRNSKPYPSYGFTESSNGIRSCS